MSGVDVVVGVRVVVVVVVVVVGVVVVVVVVDAVVEAVVVVAVDVVVVAVGSVIVVVVVTVVAVVVVVVVIVVIVVIVVVEVMRVDSVGAGVVAGSVWRYVGEKCLWISVGGGRRRWCSLAKRKGQRVGYVAHCISTVWFGSWGWGLEGFWGAIDE